MAPLVSPTMSGRSTPSFSARVRMNRARSPYRRRSSRAARDRAREQSLDVEKFDALSERLAVEQDFLASPHVSYGNRAGARRLRDNARNRRKVRRARAVRVVSLMRPRISATRVSRKDLTAPSRGQSRRFSALRSAAMSLDRERHRAAPAQLAAASHE